MFSVWKGRKDEPAEEEDEAMEVEASAEE